MTLKEAFTKELVLCTIVIIVFLPFAVRDVLTDAPGKAVTLFIAIVVIAFLVFSLFMNSIRIRK